MDDETPTTNFALAGAKLSDDAETVLTVWTETTRKRPGRPSKKTPELIAEVRIRLACGESLRKIAKDDHMPNYSTMKEWRMDDPDFREVTNEAYRELAHTYREMHFDILTGELPLPSHQDRKNAADGIKWQAAKLNRVDFGDKVEVEIDTSGYTIVSSNDFLSMLSAPPEIVDGEFVEVEALEDGREDGE